MDLGVITKRCRMRSSFQFLIFAKDPGLLFCVVVVVKDSQIKAGNFIV